MVLVFGSGLVFMARLQSLPVIENALVFMVCLLCPLVFEGGLSFWLHMLVLLVFWSGLLLTSSLLWDSPLGPRDSSCLVCCLPMSSCYTN